MDSEEQREVQEAIRQGKPETDEGPYYHQAWWEAYKGGVKGLIGGLLLGSLVGALIGVGAAGALVGMELLSSTMFGSVVAAFAAGGMLIGAEEFSTVGIVAGSGAASQEKAEERSRQDLARAVGELKAELTELKALVQGKGEEAAKRIKDKARHKNEEEIPRTRHCDDHCPPEERKLIFWKVAVLGGLLGAGAGALMAAGGVSEHLLKLLGTEAAHQLANNAAATLAATATVGGLVGASFGINRDLFRQVFDLTDHWFKGVVIPGKEDRTPAMAKAHEVESQAQHVVAEEKPRSETYFRDKVIAAQKALNELDHTQAIRH